MSDSADENAIRILLNDHEAVEERILSARHLENSETDEAFSALLNIARSPQEEKALLQAAGRSLAKVADALSRTDAVTDLNPAAHAAYRE